jgi:Phosphotransferase enzyme family
VVAAAESVQAGPADRDRGHGSPPGRYAGMVGAGAGRLTSTALPSRTRSYALLMRESPPSPAAVERAAALAGPDATVHEMRALVGGTHACTSLIRTVNPECEFVLREFPPGDAAVSNETRVLAALDGLDGLAPRLLASEMSNASSGGSWLLISCLPGVADLTSSQPAVLAEQFGRALARIHATDRDRLAGFQSVFDRPEGSLAAVSGPAASAVTASRELLARAPAVLTHCDFWSGNTLRRDGVLTGWWTGPVAVLARAGSMWAGAGWTCTCFTASPSPACSWIPTKRRAILLCPNGSGGTCGPSPDLTNRSSPGPRITVIWGAPT